MTSISGLDRLSLKSPAALVAAIPYLLGFHPSRSVVVVWLEGQRLLLTQRLDQPPHDGRADDAWVNAVWGHAAAARADEMIVVAYDGPLREVTVTDLLDRATSADVRVRDLLVVDGGRWRSQLCTDDTCCPALGQPIPEVDHDEVGAEFALLGRAPLASREELVAGFVAEPADPAIVAAVESGAQVSAGVIESWRDRVIADILELLRTAPDARPSASAVATIVCGLADVRVRDTILWEAARWPAESLSTAVAVLQPVVRAAPAGWVAPAATCCAALAWLVGDGARALTALDRATADDADYSLARLLEASVASGLPPSAWREAMAGLTRADCRHGT